MNKLYETDFTKGIYRLEDFCNALKDNNCIIDIKVFSVWHDLVNTSFYDSVRFIIFAKEGELTFGQWVACKHDLVITDSSSVARSQLAQPTDYEKQKWEDFYPLNESTSYIWERLLFQSAVKPVDDFSVDTNVPVFKAKVHKIKINSKKNRKV